MVCLLAGELTHHLGCAKGEPKPSDLPEHRNGSTPKAVLTEHGARPLAITRRNSNTSGQTSMKLSDPLLPVSPSPIASIYSRSAARAVATALATVPTRYGVRAFIPQLLLPNAAG